MGREELEAASRNCSEELFSAKGSSRAASLGGSGVRKGFIFQKGEMTTCLGAAGNNSVGCEEL